MFSNYRRKDSIMLVVGNKTDLKQMRKVSQEQAYDFAKKKGIGYCQVSAKKGDGIPVLFESIIDNILVVSEAQTTAQQETNQ